MFSNSKNSILRASLALFALCGVLGLTACSLDGSVEYLNGGPKGAALQGKALMFQTSSQSQSLSNVSLSTCTDKKVTIHAVKTDGSIETSSLGESKVSEDGSFEIPDSSQYPLGDSVTYVLMASGCGESFYRPVTDYTDQDISMGTTFLGFLPEVDDSGKKQLNTLTLSQMSTVLAKLTSVNESNLSQSFDAIAQDVSSKAAFEALTGISMESLKEIPPTTVAISLPSTIKEGQSNNLSVTASHWYSGYSKAYQWIVDGVSHSTASNLSWSLGKNTQGPHTVVLKVGANGGAGNIDLGKPVYQKSMSLNVQDTYPATPPAVTMLARTNSSAFTVTLNTGAALVNCETFSSIALTEGFLPPSASDFTRTCTTSGTQTESFTLSNTESTRQVSVWVKDAAGNTSTTYSGQFVTLDTTPPDLTLNNLTGTQTANTSTSIHWSASDLSGLASLTLQYASDGTTFSDVVDLLIANSTSPYTWMVPADNVTTAKLKLIATDNAGNSNVVTTGAFSIDATVPGPPVATLSGAPTITNGAFDISINFTEAITGLAASDFSVTNGSASNLVTASGGSYTLTITPSIASGSTGVTTVKLPLGTVVDYSSDPNSADSNTLSVNVDKTVPTITLSSTDPNPTTSSITVIATLSESVTGFDSSDITVNNALVSSFGGSGTSYSFTLMPLVDGTFSAQVGAASFTDAASNPNAASNTLSRTYDTIRPTVTLSSTTADPTNGAIAVTATFSESVTGFDASDVTVTNATVSAVVGSGITYTFTVTPTITSGNTGTVTILVPASKAQDSAGLLNTASNTLTYSIDKIAPTVTLSSTTSDPTNGVITVTATFSKSVTGFDSSDVTVTNATVSAVVGSGTTYAFNVSPTIASGSTGTVTIDVNASSAQDGAGNNSSVSNTLTYSIDKQAPTVSISSVSPDPTSSSVTVSVSFSENVTGFDSSDLTITSGTVSSVAGSGSSYTVVVAHSIGSQTTGTLSIQVAASGATDAAGNANTASNTLTRSIDTRGPSVTLTSASASTVTGSFGVTATLSLSSTDFASGDVSVTGGSVSNFSGSGTSYTFDVAPDAQQASPGTISVSVAAGTLTDSTLGNANTVSNTLTRTATTLTQSWSTTLSSSDGSVLPVTSGVASLSSTNLTQTDFSTGTHNGTTYDSTNGNRLTLDKTLPSPKELDISWAPKWTNLVGYWKLNTNFNATVGSNLTASGAGAQIVSTNPQIGAGSALFDGASHAYGTTANTYAFPDQTFTVSAWVKTTTTTSDYFISNGGSSMGWAISVTSGKAIGMIKNCSNSQWQRASSSTVNDGNWHLITAVFTTNTTTLASNDIQVYVDGVLNQGTLSSPASGAYCDPAANRAVFIGARSLPGATGYFNGSIDDARIWNTSLTASEILYLYNKQNPSFRQSELDSSWTPHWSDLVGYWPLNESTLTGVAGDVLDSLNSNHGQSFGTITPAQSSLLGTAYTFDGTSAYVKIPNTSAAFSFPNAYFTASAWIKTTATGTVTFLANEGVNRGWLFYLASGRPAFVFKNSSNANVASRGSTMSVNDGNWHHVVAVVKGDTSAASHSINIYVDGLLSQGSLTASGPFVATTASHPISIGARGISSGVFSFFPGTVDDVAIWTGALTGPEIMQIHSRQKQKFGGSYISTVMAAPVTSSWTKSNWLSSLPFFKEIPGDTNADSSSDSESSTDYSGIATNFGSGLSGLWHLDEASYNGTTSEAVDSSGLGRHGKLNTGSATNATGVLRNATTFSSGYIRTSSFDLGSISEFTFSIWVKLPEATPTQKYGIIYKGAAIFELYAGSGSTLSNCIKISTWSCVNVIKLSDWDQWHQITASYDGTTIRFYRDGKEIATRAVSGAIPASSSWLSIGQTSDGLTNGGTFDEAAIWSRTLSATEILQLYRRGANRNKFQFRTCTQSDCSDKTDADWVGPDKTASTWFSDLHNMTAVASTGDGSGSINLTAPLLDFSKWIVAVSGWAFSPTPARYFQYRALMESDDINDLCLDSSSNPIPCMPDITSVTPTAELSPAPYITSSTGISFYTTLSSLSFTISGTCASDSNYPAKFQLSKDGGSTYQYYNGTSWATASSGTYSQASTIAQINAGLSSYTCSSAPCTLTFRAYPGTNAANSCNISAPVASVNRY